MKISPYLVVDRTLENKVLLHLSPPYDIVGKSCPLVEFNARPLLEIGANPLEIGLEGSRMHMSSHHCCTVYVVEQ